MLLTPPLAPKALFTLPLNSRLPVPLTSIKSRCRSCVDVTNLRTPLADLSNVALDPLNFTPNRLFYRSLCVFFLYQRTPSLLCNHAGSVREPVCGAVHTVEDLVDPANKYDYFFSPLHPIASVLDWQKSGTEQLAMAT